MEQFSNQVQDYLNVQSIPNASCAYLPTYAYFSPLAAPPSSMPVQSYGGERPSRNERHASRNERHASPNERLSPKKPIRKEISAPEEEKQLVVKKSPKKVKWEKKEVRPQSNEREMTKIKENTGTMNYICIILVLLIVLLILYILYLHRIMKM
jgi:hypothetical protein